MKKIVKQKLLTNRDSHAVDAYFNEIAKFPVLSPEQEMKLFIKIKNGDLKAKEKLINSNLKFVVTVAKQYQHIKNIDLLDLINEGNIGLVKAVDRFDTTTGNKFISYAVWWIRQTILEYIAKSQKLIKLPSNRISENMKLVKFESEFFTKNGYDCPTDILAEELGIEKENIPILLSSHDNAISLTSKAGNSEDNSSMIELIKDENSLSPDFLLDKEDELITIKRLMNRLNKREHFLVENYYGLDGKMTKNYNQLASEVGVSSEMVRLIIKRAIIKMQSRNNLRKNRSK